ncbi:MAG TPA: DUF177 domain-containing protein [Candidatus Limnocylindria bacterium]|nr:DUF177 domain-containing protein [Candidatus Limnocylindria bacterium]
MSAFILNLAALRAGLSRIEARAPAGELDLPVQEWPGWIQATIEVDRTGDLVSVLAHIHAVARLQCVRCLTDFEAPLEVDLRVLADRAGTGRGLEADLERDDYMKFHNGRQLDLRQETREALLLALPITPHCQETCLGLCLRCGADLNQGACGCAQPA